METQLTATTNNNNNNNKQTDISNAAPYLKFKSNRHLY
jgi:hypothetical protein